MSVQTKYQNALKFAALHHADQTIPGTDLPYVVHLSNVAMEVLVASQNSQGFNIEFAIQVALLHDVLEDTEITEEELRATFGTDVTNAVEALTKNSSLPKHEKMIDSLARIKKLSNEVWSVKLADRITNLQRPPQHWSNDKIKDYRNEAITILENLKGGNAYLEERLTRCIADYQQYIL